MISRNDHRASTPSDEPFVDLLSGADRRSIAQTDRVAALATEPASFASLWALLRHADPLVRMRAADAAEKASRARPELLQGSKTALLDGSLEDGSHELTWHLLPMAARLDLSFDEASRLMRRLEDAAINDPSHVVQAEALGAAFTLAGRHRRLQNRARLLAKDALASPSEALAARARQLLGRDRAS
jgi:hypothetical protein